jgi:hypothetical protein
LGDFSRRDVWLNERKGGPGVYQEQTTFVLDHNSQDGRTLYVIQAGFNMIGSRLAEEQMVCAALRTICF